MNIKTTFATLTSLAAIGITASMVQAQGFPIQQGQYRVQQQQYPVQQGRIIQGSTYRGGVIQGRPQQSQGSTSVALTEAQRSKTGIGATLVDAGSAIGIQSIFTNGPAQRAELISGQMLTKVNGQAVNSVAAFNAMMEGMKSGDVIKLTRRTPQGKESDVSVTLMTIGEIMEASNVPEAGAYDGAVRQTENSIMSLKQQIKNTEEDLTDLKKRLTDQEKNLVDVKAKAKKSAEDAAMLKKENDAKRAANLERLKKEREAAAEAAADAKLNRSSN